MSLRRPRTTPRHRRGVPVRGTAALLASVAITSLLAAPAGASATAVPGRPAATTGVPAADAGFGEGGWWWDAMGVDDLHRSGTGTGVTVAVVDTPIDPEAPEVRGVVSSSSSPCLADGGGTMSPRATGREAEHGTTMVALIAGTGRGSGPGGTGIRGIAPDADVLHYAVSYPNPDRAGDLTCGIRGPGYDEVADGVIASIRAAVAAGADIINLSVVTDYDAEYGAALLEAYRAGVIVVAGTDNSGRGVMWPALGNGVVVVNPVDRKGRVYGQSVKDSPRIGFTAPGKGVNALGYEDGRWRSTFLADGSSNATALVSGGLAALWSAHPDATANQVLRAATAGVGLRRSDAGVETWFRREGGDLPQVTERNPAYGWGIFAPADAVATDPTTLPDTNPMAIDDSGEEPAFADVTAAAAAPGTSASPSATASASPAPSTTGRPSAAAVTDDGGTPWALVGLAVLAAVAAALVLARRRATPTTTGGTRPAGQTVTTGAPGAQHGARADGEE